MKQQHKSILAMQTLGTFFIHKGVQVTVHTYESPADGEKVCSHIVETLNKLVILDAQLLRPYAKELRQYADRLNKPIDRIIVSHAHPDHWFGLEYFTDVPIYAFPEVKFMIDVAGDGLLAYKRQEVGDLVADKKVLPSHELKEGTETIDGVPFLFTKIIDGEAPVSTFMELPDEKAVFPQDVVYNRIYLVVGEKNQKGEYLFDGWINALKTLQTKQYDVVFAGHGAPTDMTIIPELIEYISYVKQLFESGIGEDELIKKIVEKYPHYHVPQMLEFMKIFLYHRTW